MVSPSRDAGCNYSPDREKQLQNYVVSFRIILHCHRSCSTATATPANLNSRLSPQLICRANAQSDVNAACPTVKICRRGLHASRPNAMLVCAPAGDPGLMVSPLSRRRLQLQS
ncbi:hypothetical protein CEXT_581341 [Caerostris extrusa]|uniref:Uncharacterized protein n=1 Tax=Caerostris extrusa TaxID=172846 RepID=A0AAV4VRB9_CAEEX|nr:hypothetical protein CEXT_581341 [Caerostris extrusa]